MLSRVLRIVSRVVDFIPETAYTGEELKVAYYEKLFLKKNIVFR
jgi:hypothetical protein